jgi:hypothetical protein
MTAVLAALVVKRLQNFLDSLLTDGREVVSLKVGRSLPQGRLLVLISVRC